MVYDPIQWPCVLVQDAVEQDRLVAQHYLLRTAFGGNDYTAPVHFLLSQQQQQQPLDESLLGPVVLDIGCGLGQWSMEMATAYPKSTFIGVDLLDNFPQDIKPKNCRFMSLDVRQLPLPFDDQSIDYIYQRDLNWGLLQDEWNPLIKEYMRILKPGGWIELVEADMETKSSLGKECAMNDKLLEGFGLRHQDPYAARRLPSMLATCGFRRVESQFQSLPLGWSNQNQAITSQYIFYLRSLGPWLRLVMGLNQEKYMDYVDQLPLEWNQAQTYVNWHCATAQKPYKS
ncbi:S-adenosyl-L-methionine-dependent methyltransferase [Chlamydoabsidia padenii]|nr:S-adenosyl-L-methionine-dependent methyltransferase [Chlamydoabsidia padenii]